jgi:hypothetical protein
MRKEPAWLDDPGFSKEFARLYRDFFDRAERKRRWSLPDDIPWSQVNRWFSWSVLAHVDAMEANLSKLVDDLQGGVARSPTPAWIQSATIARTGGGPARSWARACWSWAFWRNLPGCLAPAGLRDPRESAGGMGRLYSGKETFMAKHKMGSLRVEAEGKRRYISVPVGLANALHRYLRSNRVRSSPPEPAFTGFDSIELANDVDVGVVQALLNAWVEMPVAGPNGSA